MTGHGCNANSHKITENRMTRFLIVTLMEMSAFEFIVVGLNTGCELIDE